MKVQALNHLTQTVGCLSVERVLHTVFDLDEDTAVKAAAAGIVKILDIPKLPASTRQTKVEKNRETK